MIRRQAYAKVNLFLEITGQRRDGYRRLSTLFQTISLADELAFRVTPGPILLTCSDPALPDDERNLAFRAAVLFKEELREKRGVAIHLIKRIPAGGGLGGGSSDAARVLKTLPTLWKRGVPLRTLASLARRLGADVPFFLQGGTCRATGIGDRLTPLKGLRPFWGVLTHPGFGVSTKKAYGWVRIPLKAERKGSRSLERLLASGRPPSEWVPFLYNRFEEAVFPRYPALQELKQEMIEAGALGALMSGSGSCVFGVAETESQARRVLLKLKRKYTRAWIVHSVSGAGPGFADR